MSKKSKPPAIKKNLEQDLAAFERLPEKTRELMRLKDQLEKTTGPAEVVIFRQIDDKAHRARL